MAYKCTNLNPYPVVVRGKTIQPNGYDVIDVIPTLTSEQKAKLVFTLVNDPSVDDASAALESSSGLSSSPTSNTAIAAAALAGSHALNQSVSFPAMPANILGAYSNKATWVYRSADTTAAFKGAWFIYAPVGSAGYYNCFVWGNYWGLSTTPQTMGRMWLGRIGTWTPYTSATNSGASWSARTNGLAYAGVYQIANVAGNTCTFTGIVGSTLVYRGVAFSNGGNILVSIDGSYTAANRLPVFTAADYAASRCRSTDVGKTYINTLSASTVGIYDVPMADGLTDAAHTIVFECVGLNYAGASGDSARAHVGGVIGCSASDVSGSPGTASRAIAHVEAVCDITNGSLDFIQVPEVQNNAANAYEFLGGPHAGETEVSFTVNADGVSQSGLGTGAWTSASVVRVTLVSTMASTDLTGTVAINKTVDAAYSGNGIWPMIAKSKFTFAVAKLVRYNYPALMPLLRINPISNGVINDRWTSVAFGSYQSVSADFASNDGADRGKVPAYVATATGSHGHVAAVALLDGGASVQGFALSSDLPVFMEDRTDGAEKIYFARSTANGIESFAIGDSFSSIVGWGVAPAS